jgi:hypothetical protein
MLAMVPPQRPHRIESRLAIVCLSSAPIVGRPVNGSFPRLACHSKNMREWTCTSPSQTGRHLGGDFGSRAHEFRMIRVSSGKSWNGITPKATYSAAERGGANGLAFQGVPSRFFGRMRHPTFAADDAHSEAIASKRRDDAERQHSSTAADVVLKHLAIASTCSALGALSPVRIDARTRGLILVKARTSRERSTPSNQEVSMMGSYGPRTAVFMWWTPVGLAGRYRRAWCRQARVG